MNGPTDSIGFNLPLEPAHQLVNLGLIQRDGHMALGADDVVAG